MPVVHPPSPKIGQSFPEPAEPSPGRGVFKTILRAATAVAAATVPGVAPIVHAVVGATSRRSPLLGAIGGESETLKFLQLQREIHQEVRLFEASSNVLKARHEATMSAIRNMRS
jgi:hypothetical protein